MIGFVLLYTVLNMCSSSGYWLGVWSVWRNG